MSSSRARSPQDHSGGPGPALLAGVHPAAPHCPALHPAQSGWLQAAQQSTTPPRTQHRGSLHVTDPAPNMTKKAQDVAGAHRHSQGQSLKCPQAGEPPLPCMAPTVLTLLQPQGALVTASGETSKLMFHFNRHSEDTSLPREEQDTDGRCSPGSDGAPEALNDNPPLAIAPWGSQAPLPHLHQQTRRPRMKPPKSQGK